MSLIKITFISALISIILLSCTDDKTTSNKKNPEKQITNCPINGSWCESTSTENQQKIAILFPTKIPYLKPFPIQVRIQNKDNIKPQEITIQFSMQNMQMGVNRFNLKLKQKQEDSNAQLWETEVVLPVCMSGRNDWLVELENKTKNSSFKNYFSITVQ